MDMFPSCAVMISKYCTPLAPPATSPLPASPKVFDFRGGDNTSFIPFFSKLFARAKSGDAHSRTASSCYWNGYSIMGEVRRGHVLLGEAGRGQIKGMPETGRKAGRGGFSKGRLRGSTHRLRARARPSAGRAAQPGRCSRTRRRAGRWHPARANA